MVEGGDGGKVRLRDFQSILGLNISNQDRPMITGLEGVLMTLNATELQWLFMTRSIGVVSCVTSPEDKGRPSMTSTGTGLGFWTKESL